MIQDSLIAELSKELDMDEFISFSQPNRYSLTFENDIQIDIFKFDSNYLLKGMIGSFPKSNDEAFLLRIMEANLFGIGTKSSTIGLNQENLLTLTLEVDYNGRYLDFKNKLEEFVNVMDFWRTEAKKAF